MKNGVVTFKAREELIHRYGLHELTELVKGSFEYTLAEVADDFREQFGNKPCGYMPDGSYVPECNYFIVDTFANAVIARSMADDDDLAPDEFYLVTYEKNADGGFVFSPREQWTVVELTYQPQTSTAQGATEAQKRKPSKKLREMLETAIELAEANEVNTEGPWRVKGIGITADVVNGNGRIYPAAVLAAAVQEASKHLNESLGQGRLITLTGESDHPRDKGNRRPLLSETVVNWDKISFDGKHVLVEGNLLGTALGKDIRAQMRGGVMPGLSQRSYAESKMEQVNGQKVERITELSITGYDFTVPGEQSDPEAGAQTIESRGGQPQGIAPTSETGDEEMTLEQLMALIKANPDLFKGLATESLNQLSADALARVEAQVRTTLGIDEKVDLGTALKEAAQAKHTLDEATCQKTIGAAIETMCKDLPYGKLNAAFVEAVKASNPQDEAAVKALVESKRKEYDVIVAQARLAAMGHDLAVLGPVIESDTDTPAFAAGAHEFFESLVKRGLAVERDLRKPKTINETFAREYLERYDKKFKPGLLREAKMLEEAEQTSDLSLPYSVTRAVIQVAFPLLIATGIFDVQMTDQAPSKIFYEKYTRETGADGTVSSEDVTALLSEYVSLAHGRVKPGTVVVTNTGGTVTYVEGTDYVIDYGGGKIMAIATITDSQALKVAYEYLAIREGEMAAIQRGKMQLGSVTLEIKADRLAQQISSEAVAFSRSQIGWDATARTLSSLIKDVQRKIDGDLFYLALAASLSIASNSGGTWDKSSGKLEDLTSYVGVARQKIVNRFYDPTAIVMTMDMADVIGNGVTSTGALLFTAAGARPDQDINANGYIGRLKGLPVFASTQANDSYINVVNREVVAHRVYQAMTMKGPYPTFDATGHLIAAEQWYVEEFNGSVVPLPAKASHVVLTA
jgi:hypothetical protein